MVRKGRLTEEDESTEVRISSSIARNNKRKEEKFDSKDAACQKMGCGNKEKMKKESLFLNTKHQQQTEREIVTFKY